MSVERAAEMGFCFGVRRALRLLEEAALAHGQVETLGSAVHNRQVVEGLERLGVRKLENLEQATGNVVAIPSHGLSRATIDEMRTGGFQVIDTTCPKVRKAQVAVEELAEAGFFVVIYGDADHPEVKGLLGWGRGKGAATLSPQLLDTWEKIPRRVGILSQTTQNAENFAAFTTEMIAALLPRVEDMRVVNTICNATRKRQEAALDVAQRVDMMIVVGGRESANTRRLAEVCGATEVETHHIETAEELEDAWAEVSRIGLTAGASTPDHVIEGVLEKLRGAGHSLIP
jgi:4-hydroxy-3-methylbut-2-enyl diphosphate reductase